jgi:hypothetical protein
MSPRARAVDEMARELLARGLPVTFVARGASMWPFVRDGDRLTVAPLAGAPRLGDVVLVGGEGFGVVHRVVRVAGGRVLTKGDALPRSDGWAPLGRVLGRVVAVERRGRPVPQGRWAPLAASLARRLTPERLVRLAAALRG